MNGETGKPVCVARPGTLLGLPADAVDNVKRARKPERMQILAESQCSIVVSDDSQLTQRLKFVKSLPEASRRISSFELSKICRSTYVRAICIAKQTAETAKCLAESIGRECKAAQGYPDSSLPNFSHIAGFDSRSCYCDGWY